MALNVNIIGRDSEGNLQALKVNSEGNLEISDKDFATESTLSIIKDNQGRLYGKYGEEWLPITVDSTGHLLLASDVTVNAEGLSVDLGKLVLQAKNPSGVPVDMKSDTEGNLKVSLSGNIPTTLTLAPRGVYSKAVIKEITLPDTARSIYIELRVYGLTGTNPGVIMRTNPATLASANAPMALEDSITSADGSITHVWGAGFTKGDITTVGGPNTKLKISGLFVPGLNGRFLVVIQPTGTFGEAEGVDIYARAIVQGGVGIVS